MAEVEEPEIVTLSSKTVYRNRWMTVREDAIRRRDGSEGIYGVCEKPDFAVIIPVEPDGAMHLVEQYRYPIGARFWEFPQGAWEDKRDAEMLDVARGELVEETGLLAGRIDYVGHMFGSYGFARQGCHVFVARDLAPTSVTLHPEEQGLIARRFPFPNVLEMIRTGAIKDMTTVSALALAQMNGGLDR
ncbi:MAG TPA: NUDIX hydrolase [Acetobacteraceae bacterium]|nr:NUDIX hydrolase [Acetobacteraceae bacterium]